MAETLVHTIQFLDDNPFGTFVAGDVCTIFYDPDDDPNPVLSSTTGYHVYNNDVEIFSGGDVFYQSYTYKIEKSAQAQICNATTLVQAVRHISHFPYVFSYVEPDNPSCAVDPNTCDLIIVGTPLVRSASAENEADGEITITATSSNPIQYKLGSPFIYDDGTAQTSGHFSVLHPRDYRIYVRDSKNCSTDVLVTVPFNDTYSPILRVEYDDYVGGLTRVDVVKRDYSGAVTEVKAAGTPFERSLKGEASQDKFLPVLATKVVLNLASETDSQFADLYNNNPEEFRINYYKVTGDSEDNTAPIELPALNTWLSASTSASKPDWTTGAAPSVTVTGGPWPATGFSEILYADYAFISDRTYTITCTFTRVTTSGDTNPRTAVLAVTDSSDNEIFSEWKAADEGSNTLTLTFVANDFCDRLAFYYSSGMVVTITLNSVTGTIDGFALKGVYKVLPQQYSEEYKAPPYYVSVVATDGLPGLKDYAFLQDDGQRFNKTMKQIELIAYILRKTKLRLNIRVACNLYATDMDQTDSDDPLDQAWVDTDNYYLHENDPSLNYVLRAIIEPYGASILQENGRWNIVRVEEKRGEYDWREFDPNGVFVAHGSYNPIIDVKKPEESNRMVWCDRDQHKTLCPGYGKIMVYYHLGLKPNILENGDFRLKSVYDSGTNTYSYTIDKFGFQIVNGGYPMNETFEHIDENNVALVLDSPAGVTTGAAYILSDTYSVKMGIQNQLRIKVRFKVPRPPVSVPYQKVRMRVQYGSFYLKSDGLWTSTANELTFFNSRYDEYIENEIVAQAPDNGASDGYDFNVRLYQSFVYHADYTDFNTLTAVDAESLPAGLKTQVVSEELTTQNTIYYYELQQSEETNFIETISDRGSHNASGNAFPSSGGSGTAGAIMKGDYWELSAAGTLTINGYIHEVNIGDKIIAVVNSPGSNGDNWRLNYDPEILLPQNFIFGTSTKQWAFRGKANIVNTQRHVFSVDSINVQFLTLGGDPLDTIVREVKAELRNTQTLEKNVIHGAYSTLITTNTLQKLGIDSFSRFANTTSSIVTTNILSADLIYAGYLRSSAGAGFETWTRDGIAESTSLHAILLQTYAAQYKRSWQKITGSLVSNDRYMSFLDVLRIANDSNRLFMPIALTIDDMRNKYNGEFLELIDITSGAGSDGSSTAPFSRGFTTGFGKGYA